MANEGDGDVIDPINDDLDPQTLRAVQQLIGGYSETAPEKAPHELTDYRAGKHAAYSAIMGVLSRWLEELESERTTDSNKETSDS